MEMINAPGAMDNAMGFSYFGARYYDSDLSVWLSVDPMSDERSWISPFNYCQWNPVGRVDPNGALDWHPDINGNLIADAGDNIHTLQNYIWRNTGSTINESQATELFNSMDRGRDVTIRTLPNSYIRHVELKRIAGDHIATMLNPLTSQIHNAHAEFWNSEPAQLTLNLILILLPASKAVQLFKSLETATIKESTISAVEFLTKTSVSFWYAYDRLMGGNNLSYGNLCSEFINDIGYPNEAEFTNRIIAGKKVFDQLSSGKVNIVDLTNAMRKIFKSDSNN